MRNWFIILGAFVAAFVCAGAGRDTASAAGQPPVEEDTIVPRFTAQVGDLPAWESTTNPNGGTVRYVALGQTVVLQDGSSDEDPWQGEDGQGGTIEDSIDTHKWWINNELKGQNGTYNWQPTSEGQYLIKKLCDDDPFYVNDAAKYCYMKVDVVRAEVKRVEFLLTHNTLTDYDTDYGGDGGANYDPDGWWKNPAKNNPISVSRSTLMVCRVTIRVEPAGVPFKLIGEGQIDALDFEEAGLQSTGDDQVVPVVFAKACLDGKVDTIEHLIVWMVEVAGGALVGAGASGFHTIFVTWSVPGDGERTLRRVRWVCARAAGADSIEAVADKLWSAVAAETQFGSGLTTEWALLDPNTAGDCVRQAECMSSAVQLIGAGPASQCCVMASTDAGEGNCLEPESRVVGGNVQHLILDFNAGPGYFWNLYEGCCLAAGSYYAITPYLKAENDYEMLKALGVQQYWVRLQFFPGGAWEVVEVAEEVPIP